jgi:hypothetical protein
VGRRRGRLGDGIRCGHDGRQSEATQAAVDVLLFGGGSIPGVREGGRVGLAQGIATAARRTGPCCWHLGAGQHETAELVSTVAATQNINRHQQPSRVAHWPQSARQAISCNTGESAKTNRHRFSYIDRD